MLRAPSSVARSAKIEMNLFPGERWLARRGAQDEFGDVWQDDPRQNDGRMHGVRLNRLDDVLESRFLTIWGH